MNAPTGSEIDISLSFRITSRFGAAMPALLSASNAMPALIAPSPITATTRRVSPCSCAAIAMPSAAEIDVDECAVPNVSYSLPSRRGKPDGPPHCRSLRHRLAPAGEDLVRVGLVADVPDDAVVAACRRRSAARPSARRCRGSTTDARPSARPNAGRNARSSRASSRNSPAVERGAGRRDSSMRVEQRIHGESVISASRSTIQSADLEQPAGGAAEGRQRGMRFARSAARVPLALRRAQAARRRSACSARRPCRRSCRA